MNKDLNKSVFLNTDNSTRVVPSDSVGYKAIVDKGEVKIVSLSHPSKQATYNEIKKAQMKQRGF